MFSRFIILYFAISSLRLTPIDCCTMSCIQVCNHRVVCWPNTQTNKCVYIYIYPNTSTHTDTFVYEPTLTLTLKEPSSDSDDFLPHNYGMGSSFPWWASFAVSNFNPPSKVEEESSFKSRRRVRVVDLHKL